MAKGEVLRTIKLSDEQSDRIFAALESDDPKFLAQLIQEFLQRHTLEVRKAWTEVHRIANCDPQTETCEVSYITNEVIVRRRGANEPPVTQFVYEDR